MKKSLCATDRLRSWLSRLVNDVLPEHSMTIIRVSVGLLYLWFGLMKLPFVPGYSPDVEVIRNTWGIFFPAELLIVVAGIMETLLGLLLLAGFMTRFLGTVLVLHVLGTFTSLFLNPGYFFDAGRGPLAFTFAGQYIVKNVLLLAAGFVLALHRPRRFSRFPLRLSAELRLGEQRWPALTVDFSLGGVGLLVFPPTPEWNHNSDVLGLSVYLPVEGRQWQLSCRTVYSYFLRQGQRYAVFLGCEFAGGGQEALANLEPYLTRDSQVVFARLGGNSGGGTGNKTGAVTAETVPAPGKGTFP